jgi:hypothetical protein
LHAKTYLQRNNWGQVLSLTTEVITSGIYNLKLFKVAAAQATGIGDGDGIRRRKRLPTPLKPATRAKMKHCFIFTKQAKIPIAFRRIRPGAKNR